MAVAFSIRELADLLHKPSNPWKLMGLLRVYLDESGTHKGSKIAAIGGLLGTKETWASIEDQWLTALEVYADAGVTWFHSSDCESGEGEFARIPVELRWALANKLARIIGGHKVLPVWSAVVVDDWNTTVQDENFLNAFPKPIYLCFRNCAQILAAGSENLGSGSTVAVVYAEQLEFQQNFGDVWDAYRRNKRRANLSSFTTVANKDCVPLQAADLVAYEMYQEWVEKEFGAPQPPLAYRIRKPLHHLREGGLRFDFGGCYDSDSLQLAMKRHKETGDI